MLDISKIKAISIDLDDTLWPIGPVISRAEEALVQWLHPHAPVASAVFRDPQRRALVRQEVLQSRPDIHLDLAAIRRESIRLALHQSEEDTLLAEPASEVFYAERNRVDLYGDTHTALTRLAAHFPVLALSNGNADVQRVGLGRYFVHSISACDFGFAKPDPQIFLAGAKALGVGMGEVLHVGDDAVMDVLGALDAGMQTVWLNRMGHDWPHTAKPHATVADLLALCDLLELPASV